MKCYCSHDSIDHTCVGLTARPLPSVLYNTPPDNSVAPRECHLIYIDCPPPYLPEIQEVTPKHQHGTQQCTRPYGTVQNTALDHMGQNNALE